MTSIIDAFERNLIENNNYNYLLDGFKTTIIVTIVSLFFSLIVGLIVALIRSAKIDIKPGRKKPKEILLNILDFIAKIYVTVVRGTPSTIQLLIVFNVILVNIDNLLIVAIVTFSINSSAYMSELFRGGIQAVDKGEIEAARSLGLNYWQTMKLIVLPQAFKNSLPALGNEIITLFKETSISGFIGLVDLTRGAAIIISRTFEAAIPYFAAAMIYLVVVLILEQIFKKLEKRYAYA
ncbi:amino acid ABC transporter permease [Anaerococcus sp. AGMB09787]|uniref:amino acid ABC transporter permease n=1 Tax=Anaerococcus sp. AGMB09787 TaxID=2922869 RepID=UPI001FAFE3B7|nr:amino acid ABC transporter permease [Anaerococcus sp. AGMB09787]